MSQLIKISKNNQLRALECKTLEVLHQEAKLELILLCDVAGEFRVFLNKCPHTGVNLNWQPNQCFDHTKEYVICSLHGALFQPEDGLCVYGPCSGQSLTMIPCIVSDDGVFIESQIIENL